jgi:hypothetical protein
MVCDVEHMMFTFALFGAEGAGSDSQILRLAAQRMIWIEGGFLLGDGGYGLSASVQVPYRGVRYHLKEFHPNAGGRPKDYKELFNLRHAQLRNIIERCFGLLKRRFKILRNGIDMANPNDIWGTCYSCVAIHNYIRATNANVDADLYAEVFAEADNAGNRGDDEVEYAMYDHEPNEAIVNGMRDTIARTMWDEYVQYQNAHPELFEI